MLAGFRSQLRRVRGGAAVRFALVAVAAACSTSDVRPPPVGGGPEPRPSLNPTYRPSGHMAAGDVFVHLFEWKWTDIAAECENVLGPAGFKAVQISPPQEHSVQPPGYPWSERYQPVRYNINKSRSGTGLEFQDMVNRCNAVGVDVYVDAVINHMTNSPSPGFGSDSSPYSKYDYPGLYTPADFHPACTVTNYADAANVQDCELFGLPDLNTGKDSVRRKIAGYLIMLAHTGVAGFRVDAAKHVQQVELNDILTVVDSTLTAESRPIPYYFLEVSSGAGEALHPSDYYGEAYSSGGTADITEFTFSGIDDKFTGLNGQHISQLNPNGSQGNQFSEAAWGLMPSDKAVVFIENHDTQHNCGLSYRQPPVFRLANVWMLAQPYGYPSILSSYAFDCPGGDDMGPPSDASGNTNNVNCATSLETATVGQWVCEHRDSAILKMVAFRRVVAGSDLNHWWDDGANAIAFSRGAKGFVAINRDAGAVDTTIATGMAPGRYGDLLSGSPVVVDSTGAIRIQLAANSAVAIDVATKQP